MKSLNNLNLVFKIREKRKKRRKFVWTLIIIRKYTLPYKVGFKMSEFD